jgi:amidase
VRDNPRAVPGSSDSAERAVGAALERIESDPLGAVVRIRPEALAEARSLDRRRGGGARAGPLDGVPFTAKDVLASRGLETSAGSRAFEGYVPAHDAPAIARLRAAGAVLVGKTNCSELALSAWTGNPLFGETRHPFAAGRSPGGSSGGCAAAVAAGYVRVSLGSDYGGSIRFPAACCGVVGLRPSPGRVACAGQVPSPPPRSPRACFSLVGPIASSAAELTSVFSVLAGCRSPPPRLPARAVHAGDDAAVGRVAGALEGAGAVLEPAAPPWLDDAAEVFSSLRELDTFADLRDCAGQLGPELQELVARAPRRRPSREARELEQRARELRGRADRFLHAHPLLIVPLASCETPPPAGAPVEPEDLAPCRAISLLGLPAVSIGGVQLIAARGRDEDALSAAQALEAIGTPLSPPR